MKRVVLVLGAVFVVALGIAVGNRMSDDAMAVVVGVTCGVLASIPTSLLVVWANNRRAETGIYRERHPMGLGSQFPPVVVVNSGEGYARHATESPPQWLGHQSSSVTPPREFRVVGEPDSAADWSSPRWSGRIQ